MAQKATVILLIIVQFLFSELLYWMLLNIPILFLLGIIQATSERNNLNLYL